MPRGRVAVERRLRITVQDIVYEAVLGGEETGIVVYGGPLGNDEIQLDMEEIEELSDFFNEVMQESMQVEEDMPQPPHRTTARRIESEAPAAARGEEDRIPGGQGRVKNPETDARLKGNEMNRPTDPDRSAQAEGGRRGGIARRGRPPTRK